MPLIRLTGFTKRYRGIDAVAGLDLTVNRGEIYGLLGPDGAGKSSVMKAIAGVLAFEAGTVSVFDVTVDSEAAAERIKPRLGFMPQGLGLNLYPNLSVAENIDFFARLRGVPEAALRERRARLLAITRLAPFRDRPMKQLSGGMKQKLGLACTLIHAPELVILDEPTTGVDPLSRRDFWAILAELLREHGTTALVSTAYLDEASRFHRISLLHGGRELAQGEPEVLRAAAPGMLVTLRAEPQGEALARLRRHHPQVERQGPRLRVFVDDADRTAAAAAVGVALADLPVSSLTAEPPELEDLFVALLRRRGLQELPPLPPPGAAAAMEPGDAIEARELVRDFDGFRAVDRVSFRVRQGEIFGLLGANGAGKTTAIKMLTGILPPSAGEGRVAGADMRHASQLIKSRIGYMSQAFSLYLDLSVAENLRLFAGIYGLAPRAARDRIRDVLALTGLTGAESRVAADLPMGMRQRLAVACALVHEPRILFLDEPTSGVDPVGRRHLWEILYHLARERGVALLVTTHHMSEAEHCDHLALLYAGRVVADATPEAMKAQVRAEAGALLELACDEPLTALPLLDRAGFAGVALHGPRIHLLARDPVAAEATVRRLLAGAGLALHELRERPLTMEDVFVHRVMGLEREAAA